MIHPLILGQTPTAPSAAHPPLLGQEGSDLLPPLLFKEGGANATGWFEGRLPPPRPLRGHPPQAGEAEADRVKAALFWHMQCESISLFEHRRI